MRQTETIRDAFLDELRDAYDAENQLTKALPKMARAATSEELRTAFENHLEQTRHQVERLEQVFRILDEKVKGKRCKGIAGIIEEGDSVMKENLDDAAMDAVLIAGGQRAEHYEIAAYGSLAAWARSLGYHEVVDLLLATLEEEKAADETLTSLAEGGINDRAARENGRESEGSEGPSAGGGRAPRRRGAGRGEGGGARRASTQSRASRAAKPNGTRRPRPRTTGRGRSR